MGGHLTFITTLKTVGSDKIQDELLRAASADQVTEKYIKRPVPGQGRECGGRKFLKKKNTLVNRKIHSLKEKTLVVKKIPFVLKVITWKEPQL